jgi:carbon storage regulator
MLILTRRTNQNLIINNDVIIKILNITNGQVKIGIEAPKNIPVYREELFLKIQKEKENDNR